MLATTLTCAAALLVGQTNGMPDLGKVRPPLLKEPAYKSKAPVYGIAAFGPKAGKALWLVLDGPGGDNKTFDTLYVDLDGDGDLTDPAERLTPGPDGRFRLKDFTDPATGLRHGDLTVRYDAERNGVMFALQWRGQHAIGGGYPEDPQQGYMQFVTRNGEAPVLWLWGDGPFRFQRWCGGKLGIGRADDLALFLGQPGRGKSSFCGAQQHFLPEGEYLKATLIYKDGMGKERRASCELRERC